MNRKPILTIASIACASVIAVTALFAVKANSPSFVFGTGSVKHTIVFDNGDISDYLEVGGEAAGELSVTTDAGNTFKSTDLIIYDYTGAGPVRGGTSDDYLFLIHHYGWQYGYVDTTPVFTIDFEMNVDVTSGVTAFATYTTHYDDGENTSFSTKNADFDIVTSDDLEYLLEYRFFFANKYFDYVTIDSITIEYSCTY